MSEQAKHFPWEYEWGRILTSTQNAKDQLGITLGSKGICLGFKGPKSLRVLRCGYKAPQIFSVDYWEPTKNAVRL